MRSDLVIPVLGVLVIYVVALPLCRINRLLVSPVAGWGELLARFALGLVCLVLLSLLVGSWEGVQLAYLLFIVSGFAAVFLIVRALLVCFWKGIVRSQVFDNVGAIIVVVLVEELWVMVQNIRWP